MQTVAPYALDQVAQARYEHVLLDATDPVAVHMAQVGRLYNKQDIIYGFVLVDKTWTSILINIVS